MSDYSSLISGLTQPDDPNTTSSLISHLTEPVGSDVASLLTPLAEGAPDDGDRNLLEQGWGYLEGTVLSLAGMAAFPAVGTVAAGRGLGASGGLREPQEFASEVDRTFQTFGDMTQATTPEGLKVQQAVGDVFHYLENILEPQRQKAQDALTQYKLENPDLDITQIGTHIDTATKGWIYLFPMLGPRVLKGYRTYKDMKEIDRIMKPINEKNLKDKTLRENKDLPYDMTPEELAALNKPLSER